MAQNLHTIDTDGGPMEWHCFWLLNHFIGASTPQRGHMTTLSINNLIELCRSVGFTEAQIPMAVAIALAESGGDPQATNTAGNTPPSTDRGLWQINSYWHAEVTDACAFDPTCCAKAALKISGGSDWHQWSTYGNGAYKQFLPQVQAAMGAKPVGMGYWAIRNPWNLMLAIDEFGPGTKDGNPADGHSTDACGPASIENGKAAYEQRPPTYTNIGNIRQDMLHNGQFDPNGTGCRIENVAWAIPRGGGYSAVDLHVDNGTVFHPQDVYNFLAAHPGHVHIFLVTDAEQLAGNEHNVFGHFASICAYGGDRADGSMGKVYVLNSDIAGQHGLATGQWMEISDFCRAVPMGHVCMVKGNAPAPTPPPEAPAVVIFEKDANGVITGAHDANDTTKHLGGGMAQAVEHNGWEQGSIAVGETPLPNEAITYAVLRGGAKVAMTYSAGSGVHSYGGDVVNVLNNLFNQLNAPKPPAPTKPNYDHLISAVESATATLHDALRTNGEAS